jgi:hypothetical protein
MPLLVIKKEESLQTLYVQCIYSTSRPNVNAEKRSESQTLYDRFISRQPKFKFRKK